MMGACGQVCYTCVETRGQFCGVYSAAHSPSVGSGDQTLVSRLTGKCLYLAINPAGSLLLVISVRCLYWLHAALSCLITYSLWS